MSRLDPNKAFDELNRDIFKHKVTKIPVLMNDRLCITAGRCHYMLTYKDSIGMLVPTPYKIDIHSRLFDDIGWEYRKLDWPLTEFKLVLLHEMMHAFLMEHYYDVKHSILFQKYMTIVTGKDINHTFHHCDVTKWRYKRGTARDGA